MGKIDKNALLSTPDPVDCSWCASEQGAPTTDSPSICDYHDELMQQQSANRRATRHDMYVSPRNVRQDETLADFVGRKLRGR